MNLALRGISHNLGDIADSSFLNDQHKGLYFNYSLKNDARWADYVTPPESNANYAWILHMLYHLDKANGVAGFLLANGALNDSDTLEIRKKLIQNDKVEAIVVLPRELFITTDISVTLWILNQNKKGGEYHNRKLRKREHEILFMDLRQWTENAVKNENKKKVRLIPEQIEKAAEIYHTWQTVGILKDLFVNYDITPFLNPNADPYDRYRLLAKATEYVFTSAQILKTGKGGKNAVTFKTYFLQAVKRLRASYDIAQPSGNLSEEESALAQCFMAIAGFVRKMSGTDAPDTDTMNKQVSKMVEEALKYNKVENVFETGVEEELFTPEYFDRLADIKLPATKLELLIKMLKKQIKEYGKTNGIAAKTFQEMLEKTIEEYHERRKLVSTAEAGAIGNATTDRLIKNATAQALEILKKMNESRESFRKMGLTFEEKAFYDILIAMRDQHNFVYGEDKEVNGVIINEKCKDLAIKVKALIDEKSSYADWLNNSNVRARLEQDVKICLIKNGYPPTYSKDVFKRVMDQVKNFKENDIS